jgi:hypothetical protein
MATTTTPLATSSGNGTNARGWTSICRALPFRGRRRSNSQPALNGSSHDSVLIGDGFETAPATSDPKPEGRGGPIKKTVRKLMRRASHSFRPGNEKGPLVVSGPGRKGRGKGRALMGDAESGIVLDEKDVGDSYYCADALMKRVGMRNRHLPSVVSRMLIDWDTNRPRRLPSRRDHIAGHVIPRPSESCQLRGGFPQMARGGG